MPRPHIEAIHYTAAPLEDAGGAWEGAKWHVLSRDDADPGAITTVTELPKGFSAEPESDRSCEFFVLNGTVSVLGRTVGRGQYAYIPPSASDRRISAADGGTIYLWFGDRGAGGGEPLVVDPDTIPYGIHTDEDVPQSREGRIVNIVKMLRRDPDSGDTVGMSVMYPGFNQDCAEGHPASDEGFMLRGDMLALDPRGNPTELIVGSYNWRPAHVRHLPKYSYYGNLRLFRAQGAAWDGKLDYYEEPRWPEIVARYKSKHRFF
jgi:hypothetical protein